MPVFRSESRWFFERDRRISNAMTQWAFVGRLRACRRNCGPEVPSIRAEPSSARSCCGKSVASLHCACHRRLRGRSGRLRPAMHEMDLSWPRSEMTSTSFSWRDWKALSGPRSSPASQKARYAIGRDGRRYITASPHLAQPNLPTKDRWWEDAETDSAQTALPRGHPLRR